MTTQNYCPPDYETRARHILSSGLCNSKEFFERLGRIGFKPDNFAAKGPNEYGLVHHYIREKSDLQGSKSQFVIREDSSVKILDLKRLTFVGGKPTVIPGDKALEFLRNQEDMYSLRSKTNRSVHFEMNGKPTDNICYCANFHYDLTDGSEDLMPIEVLVDYVPQEVQTVAIDTSENEEPYTHKRGLYLRARQGPIVSALRNELHLSWVKTPKDVYERMLNLDLGSDLTQLVALLNEK